MMVSLLVEAVGEARSSDNRSWQAEDKNKDMKTSIKFLIICTNENQLMLLKCGRQA
jgi:hypothetical protein